MGGFGAKFKSNCGVKSAIDLDAVTSDGTMILELMKAIELTWTLPYAIPNDRTQADITCSTEQLKDADTNAKKFSHDPLRIAQSSMIAKGWGVGNCFYLGVALANPGKHRFQCRNMSALAKSASLQLAFQFSISNKGKALALGEPGTAGTGFVVNIAKKLTCELIINTWSTKATSANKWYQSKLEAAIDGDGQTSKSGQWSSFLVTY